MKKGGYKIIDLKGQNVTAVGGVTIKGIYDAIEGSYGKPLLLAGINFGGVEKNDIYVIPTLSGTDYVFKGYGKVFTIDDDDKVVTSAQGIEDIPSLPADASTKTYTLQAVNGVLTWVVLA